MSRTNWYIDNFISLMLLRHKCCKLFQFSNSVMCVHFFNFKLTNLACGLKHLEK